MTTTWAPTWTRTPLPADVRVATLAPTCQICHQDTVERGFGGDPPPAETRSTEPDPTGRYHLQPHHRWCPVWTGETPDPACTICGAPVHGYEYRPGYSLTVTDPVYGIAHLVGTGDAVFDGAGRYAPVQAVTPEPALSKATITPCGHVLEGSDALHVVTRSAELRAEQRRTETDQTIAAARHLLAAAEACGQTQIADAYREAVRSRSDATPGLLAALALLDPTGGAR